MKTVVGILTAPIWFPALCATASASLVLGLLIVAGGALLRGRVHDPDDWREPPDLA